jgi:23S rRNA (cytidine1920-2'-O)/16S rRNA (cytidine1409-2'-O)-methyltransferase
VIRDVEVRKRVVREIADAALGWGGEAVAAVDSGLPGPKGNREVFLHLFHREHPELPDDIDERIAAAVI